MGDDIWKAGDHFPLGPTRDQESATRRAPSQATARPFGLRYLVEPPSDTVIDLDENVAYDQAAQIGMVGEEGVLVPASRHKSRRTKTQTQRDDKRAPDDDEDVGG